MALVDRLAKLLDQRAGASPEVRFAFLVACHAYRLFCMLPFAISAACCLL